MIVRHKLLADLVRLWKNDQLVEKIDRLPIEPTQVKASGTLLCTQRTSRVEIQDVPPNGTGHDRRT
jgi:hypothetical protein